MQKVRYHVCLDQHLLEALKKAAEKGRRTPSQLLCLILEHDPAIQAELRKDGEPPVA